MNLKSEMDLNSNNEDIKLTESVYRNEDQFKSIKKIPVWESISSTNPVQPNIKQNTSHLTCISSIKTVLLNSWCGCSPEIANLKDPAQVVNSIKVAELEDKTNFKYTIQNLKIHLKKCLGVRQELVTPQYGSKDSIKYGTWSTVTSKSLDSLNYPTVKLLLELPLQSLQSLSTSSLCDKNLIENSSLSYQKSIQSSKYFECYNNTNECRFTSDINKIKLNNYENNLSLKSKSKYDLFPQHNYDNDENVISPILEQKIKTDQTKFKLNSFENKINNTYLASLMDFELTPEGKIDWEKVKKLENKIWNENGPTKSDALIRTGSFTTYIKILKIALKNCHNEAELMMDRANQFYEEQYNTMNCNLLERLSHFRLLMKDVLSEINLMKKCLNDCHLLKIDFNDQTNIVNKRWPLLTPMRIRERYARQIRVLIEALELLHELQENYEKFGNSNLKPMCLFPSNQINQSDC